MKSAIHRRSFLSTMLASASLVAMPRASAAPRRRLKIGYTCITWGTFPQKSGDTTLEAALKDISALGFWGFETFPEVLSDWDSRNALTPLIARYGVPLKSGYCGTNLTDPSKRKESIAKVAAMGKVIRKFGGTFGVLAPNGVKRESYDFKAYRDGIITGLNEHAMALNDIGLEAGLHQHTGTCIETRDEVYAVMDAVDKSHMKFAPDVGQLQKGGADAAKVVKDFLPLVRHMHLKDYSGGRYFAGYCPLGLGVVDIEGILNMLESSDNSLDVMVEMDPSFDAPMSPTETAEVSKRYLQSLGYAFRT